MDLYGDIALNGHQCVPPLRATTRPSGNTSGGMPIPTESGERPAEAGGKGGGGDGEPLGGRPTLPQGSTESNEGMVTGGGKLHPPSHRLVWKRRHQRGWASIGGTPPPKDLISILVTLVEVQEEPSEAE